MLVLRPQRRWFEPQGVMHLYVSLPFAVVYLKAGSTDAYELRSSQGGDGSYRRSSLQGDDEKTYSSYDGTNDEVRDLIKKYPNEVSAKRRLLLLFHSRRFWADVPRLEVCWFLTCRVSS